MLFRSNPQIPHWCTPAAASLSEALHKNQIKMSALQISPSVITLAIIHDSGTPVKGFCFTILFFPEFHKKRPEKHFSAGFCRLFRPLLFYLLLINKSYASIKTFPLSFYRFPYPLPHIHLGYMRNSGHEWCTE